MKLGKIKLTFWSGVFWLIMAMGAVITVIRFAKGLGAVSNLSDTFPWGIWVGFDILCRVGLSAGGFVITGIVYIFNIKRFKPIVRPAILLSFFGYMTVTMSLLFELGRPWNVWRPIVMWNPHSVMFEVAWCVMLYTTVLALEFAEIPLERLKMHKLLKVRKAVTVPLVLAGILLSTLHQSSLGAFFLIVPGKLHALWYTPLLPLLFFVSAVMVGLAMLIIAARLAARAFNRTLEFPLMVELGRAMLVSIIVYGMLRLYDLLDRGALAAAFSRSYESKLFWFEIITGIVLPVTLLLIPRIRNNVRGLYAASALTVMGFMAYRLNVSVTGLETAQGGHYTPAWTEIAITVSLVALAIGMFTFVARRLPVFTVQPELADVAPAPAFRPALQPVRLLAPQTSTEI